MVITVKPCRRVDIGGSRLLDLTGETGRKRAEGENAVKKLYTRADRLETRAIDPARHPHPVRRNRERESPMPSKVSLLPRFRWVSKVYLPFSKILYKNSREAASASIHHDLSRSIKFQDVMKSRKETM